MEVDRHRFFSRKAAFLGLNKRFKSCFESLSELTVIDHVEFLFSNGFSFLLHDIFMQKDCVWQVTAV
jgi:hypothetical protein